MTNVTPEATPGLRRRTLLRNGLLTGLGAVVVGVASPTLTGTARAEGYQVWAWCSKCQGLFYGPQQSASFCPAGGTHNGSGSYKYLIVFDFPPSSGVQSNWRWCGKCRGLFFGPQQSASFCPAGGTHNGSGSYNYSLGYGDPPAPGVQVNWRWCSKCGGLFYGAHQSSSFCPAGGTHNGSSSYNYALNYQ